MKKAKLARLVQELQTRVENLESGEIWTDALLEDQGPRVRQLESEKDNAQGAIAVLLDRIQKLEAELELTDAVAADLHRQLIGQEACLRGYDGLTRRVAELEQRAKLAEQPCRHSTDYTGSYVSPDNFGWILRPITAFKSSESQDAQD